MTRIHRLKRPRMVQAMIPVILPLLLAGCRIAEQTAKMPMKAVTAVVPGSKSPVDPANLQVEVQRFADEYASRTISALDDYAQQMSTPEAKREALRWKVSVGFATVGIASGPNPRGNLLDFVTMAAITRLGLEENWGKTGSSALEHWVRTSRALETNAWKLTESVLAPEQQQELRETIQRWWEANPAIRSGFFTRPEVFSSLVRRHHEKDDRPGSVFALIGLDPTAGLDPAVREVTQTRLFAERAMFTIQRMPFLVRWQTELLVDELLQRNQIATALGTADRLSRAVESASQTAAQLPDRITAERKAVLEALETQEGKLRALAAELSRTLAAGEKMSTSLNTTLSTFDALMKRFGVGEPPTSPPDTNSAPFNILDYARTAEQIAAMAQQLDALLKGVNSTLDSPALDRKIAELGTVSKQARADAKSVLNHAALLAAGLLIIIFAGALVYRRLASRPG